MNKPLRADRAALRKLLARERLWTRGFNRGAQNHWRARNNRKISRIAARI